MKKPKIDLISGVQKAVRDAMVISLLLVLMLGGSFGLSNMAMMLAL